MAKKRGRGSNGVVTATKPRRKKSARRPVTGNPAANGVPAKQPVEAALPSARDTALGLLRHFFDFDASGDPTLRLVHAMLELRQNHREDPEVRTAFVSIAKDPRFIDDVQNQNSNQRAVLLVSLGKLGTPNAPDVVEALVSLIGTLISRVHGMERLGSLAHQAGEALREVFPLPVTAPSDEIAAA